MMHAQIIAWRREVCNLAPDLRARYWSAWRSRSPGWCFYLLLVWISVGPIGVMAAAISRHVGARHVVVTDVNPYLLELARKMGATRAVDVRTATLPQVMRELGMTEGFDVGMEMSGNGDALRDMFNAMNHGGRVAILGLPSKEVSVDFNQVIFKGLEIRGIYGREMFETWYKMVAMLQSGLDIRPVLTHRFKAEEFEKAFEVMRGGQSGKVVVDWTA